MTQLLSSCSWRYPLLRDFRGFTALYHYTASFTLCYTVVTENVYSQRETRCVPWCTVCNTACNTVYAWHNQCYAQVSGRAADVVCSGPPGLVPGSLFPFRVPPPTETSPVGRVCPCATALARPLLFTCFACHVRVRPSVGHSRIRVLIVSRLFLVLVLPTLPACVP